MIDSYAWQLQRKPRSLRSGSPWRAQTTSSTPRSFETEISPLWMKSTLRMPVFFRRAHLIQTVNAKSAVLTSVDAMLSSDGVVEIGRANLTIEPEGQDATEMEVKYVVYWRQEDARWKWNVDIWNQNS